MKITHRIGTPGLILTLALTLAVSGCATGSNPKDPLENYNRVIFGFNDKLDQVVLKPAATVYQNVLPSFVQTGVGNFFGNIGDVWTAVNNLLQGKLENGMTDIMRVAVNSTMGFLGVLDIGSEAGLPKHREDFGQTLGAWGVQSGPYFVLPVFGSSTVRDTAALPVDLSADLWSYKDPVNVRNIGIGVRLVDQRAALLGASSLIEDAALDKYVFTRDAYLQRRQSLVQDGRSKKDIEDDIY
ncbi:MAG: VacJ family lipoprotein [Oxalobacteraceae bacterium]